MRSFELGDVIAERAFAFEAQDGTQTDFVVRIGRPVLDEQDGRTWFCPYHITGLGERRVIAMFGVDTQQALKLATHSIPNELAVYARKHAGRILTFGAPDSTFLSGCRNAIQYASDAFPDDST